MNKSSPLFAPSGAIKLPPLPVGRHEKTESIPREVPEDAYRLGLWSIFPYGEANLRQRERINLLRLFWRERGDHYVVADPPIQVHGIVVDHPDFVDGVEIDVPVVAMTRLSRGKQEIVDAANPGSPPRTVAQDQLIITTSEGVKFVADTSNLCA